MPSFSFFFFFNDTATTEIYTLSLHDALPISSRPERPRDREAHPDPEPHDPAHDPHPEHGLEPSPSAPVDEVQRDGQRRGDHGEAERLQHGEHLVHPPHAGEHVAREADEE